MPIGSIKSDSVGKTGWDVLVQYKLYFAALAAAILFILIDIFYPERVSAFFDNADAWFEANKVYFIPFLTGAILARFIYKRYIFAPVFVHVEDCSEGVSGWRFSRTYFDYITKQNGYCNPIPTKKGGSFFYAVHFDSENKVLDFGYIHSREVSPGELFARRESYTKFLTSLHDANLRSVQLSDAKFVEGVEVSRSIINSNLEIMSRVLNIKEEKVELDPDQALNNIDKVET